MEIWITILLLLATAVWIMAMQFSYYEVKTKFVKVNKGDIFVWRKIRTPHWPRIRLYTKREHGFNHVVKESTVEQV